MHRQLTFLGSGLLLAAGLLSGCAGPVPAPPRRPMRATPSAPPEGTSKRVIVVSDASGEPGEPAPPSAEPAPRAPKRTLVTPQRRPACDQAQVLIRRAEATMADGWLKRSERLLDRADALCTDLAANIALRRTKLHKAGLSTATGQELWKQSQAARAKGDLPAARRLASMAVRRYQIELGAQVEIIDVSRDLTPTLISSDGQWQVAQTKHGVMLLSGKLTPHRIFPGDRSSKVVLSPDGKRLAVGFGLEIVIWDVPSGKLLNKVSWANEQPSWFGFVGQGKQLLMMSQAFGTGTQLHLFDIATGDAAKHGKVVAKQRSFRGPSVVASPAADWIAVAVVGGGLQLIDVKTLKPLRLLPGPKLAKGERRTLKRLAVSPSGKRIAAFTGEGKLQVWDTANGKLLLDHKGLSDWFGGAIAFTKNETRVVAPSGTFGKTLVEIEISSGVARRTYPYGSRETLLAAGTPQMLVGGYGSGLRLRKLDREGSVLARLERGRPDVEDMAAGAGQLALAYEVRSGRDSRILINWWDGAERRQGTFSQKSYRAHLTFSADGQQLMANLGHGNTSIWPLAGGTRRPLPRLGSGIESAAIGLDGTVWATAGPFTTKLFAMAPGTSSWTRLLELKERSRAIWFSTDGRTAVHADDEAGQHLMLSAERATASAMPKLGKKDRWLGLSGNGEHAFARVDNTLVRYAMRDLKAAPVPLRADCKARYLTASYDGQTIIVSCDYSSSHLLAGAKSTLLLKDDEPFVLTRDGSAWITYDDGVATAGRSDKPAQRVTLQLDPDTGVSLITSPRGTYEINGKDREAFSKHLACRLGHRLYPLQLCEDIRYEDDLLARILAPEP